MPLETNDHRNHRFLIGLVMGTFVGTGLTILLVPRVASELGHRVTHSARALRKRASKRYEHASTRVADAVDDLAKRGQSVRDEVADVVVRGAHEVERVAKAVKTH
jgi:gas vesicle protein